VHELRARGQCCYLFVSMHFHLIVNGIEDLLTYSAQYAVQRLAWFYIFLLQSSTLIA